MSFVNNNNIAYTRPDPLPKVLLSCGSKTFDRERYDKGAGRASVSQPRENSPTATLLKTFSEVILAQNGPTTEMDLFFSSLKHTTDASRY